MPVFGAEVDVSCIFVSRNGENARVDGESVAFSFVLLLRKSLVLRRQMSACAFARVPHFDKSSYLRCLSALSQQCLFSSGRVQFLADSGIRRAEYNAGRAIRSTWLQSVGVGLGLQSKESGASTFERWHGVPRTSCARRCRERESST